MKQSFYFIAAAMVLLASCTQPFKKAPDGSEYKLLVNKSGKNAVKGDFIQLNIIAKYKDSFLFNSVESSTPRFIPFDTAQLPVFFKSIHEGDSLVIRVSTDTLIKKNQSAPFMKKGQFLYQYFKVAKVYSKQEEVDSAAKSYEAAAKVFGYKNALTEIKKMLVTEAPQLKTDDAIIKEYLAKNNIQATKTDWGTYVSITTPGTGPFLTDKDIASVNYTGRNLKDSVFDSSTDPRFGARGPYDVNLGEFGVVLGWIDGLKKMQKGTVGKLIIPSTLAYGKQGKGGNIGPNEVLVFDISVADVITPGQYEVRQRAKQQEMMAKQQEMMQQQRNNQAKGAPAEESTPEADKNNQPKKK